jgi:Hydrazine synthase alpha subunit middle domain
MVTVIDRQGNQGAHMNKTTSIVAAVALAAAWVVAGCGSGSTDNTVTVNGDVPLAYAKRAVALGLNPTDGAPTAPGGDLIIREKSSASAREINVTAAITQGVGDVSDPEASYDGKKIVFSMRCPTSNTSTINGGPACTGAWNVWEYDTTTGGLAGGSLRRITSSSSDDDVDPAYLPANRGFVFSSNRQTLTKSVVAGVTTFAVDEYERERVLNLHTMDANGGAITQISVNQSHDRNPVVRANGDIMFSRWEHVGPRNRFAIFRTKPDGTDMFVLYGAHSPGNSFLHPREMDTRGAFAGKLVSSLMSLSGTREGGSLMMIDAANYSEQNTPANRAVALSGGQSQMTDRALNDGRGLSLFGRVTTPFPLWDGTDRVLVSYRPCEVTKSGDVVPCATLTPAEIARLGSERTMAEAAADTLQDNAPPAYAVYMVDPKAQTWLIVAAPPTGFMYTDPVALQARPEPNATQPTVLDATLQAQGKALIEVRSVYDTDGLQRMGEPMVVAADLPAGCVRGIAQTAPVDTADTRNSVADLVKIKDPADPAYLCAPARMVRATRAMAPVAGMTGMREAIGETDFEPQQILGYAPVEPDGSFKLQVPADTPLALSILDSKGRSLQTHLNWIQVRPGERRTCDGCHSPRRGAALHSGAIVNAMPSSIKTALSAQHQSGETMASLRTRLDPAALALMSDPVYSDIWADTTKAGIQARAPIAVRYTGNANPADDLATPAPTGGVINYPAHVAPIWARDRGANTCTTCHADPTKLDLRATFGGSGRMVSYDELLIGDPVIDPVTGLPQTRLEEGVPVIVRGPALVENMAGGAEGIARSSRLAEILFGETLKASVDARTAHPNPPPTAPNHASLLNAAEKRVITEWMDLGGQYLNDPSKSPNVRRVVALSRTAFEASVLPVLKSTCVACHQPVGSSGAAQTTPSFKRNRFVLTGNPEGDYNVTLTMVTDTCNAAANALLKRPSTVPHPAGAIGQTTPVLTPTSAGYAAISSWISSGCTQ